MTILPTHFFAFVNRHLMSFSLFSAGHVFCVLTLVLKADNIGKVSKSANLSIHVFEKLFIVFCIGKLFAHKLHALNRVLLSKILPKKPGPRQLLLTEQQLLLPCA